MAFWQENYSFIKDVYETRITKMIEWMDHLEMAISKVSCVTVVPLGLTDVSGDGHQGLHFQRVQEGAGELHLSVQEP